MMHLTQFAHGYYDGMMGGGYYGDGMGWVGALLMLLFWIVVIGLIVYLAHGFMQHSRSIGGHREPLDIARERYAKGEITKEELVDIQKTLK